MFLDPVRLAFSWLTVLPVRGPDAVDRDDARRAIGIVPLVGLALGGAAALAVWLCVAADLPPLLAGLLGVGTLALLTRGMHLDGLADTADGLGSYGPAERALAIMKSGSTGPFGAATLVLILGVQAVAMGELVSRGDTLAIVVAAVAARCAVVIVCRRSVPAATGSGFGSLVAASQSPAVVTLWVLVALAAGLLAVPGVPLQGVAAVAVALAAVTLLARHCVRRFGGLVGDVLGASIELTTAVVLVLCLVG
ncbi:MULTISPECIES: adenosylcobinamide-GDP ribazoletransferase [unclassified Rhodococcus (in: high G+C Gram-positive bacteria)]|uniref:adenosylcobinamide-GDP ribazoletransferase n=1 Tax=unclassified Rhodococcus (in: high G+C Gram-positive bacteria) TaxID=192944 RepID=UPI0021C10FA0|nr:MULTISPECIES: adenosylcobinamide-GDP ribazoletransferase [unclassified Rhodococcus (in: high G+C Gram-positive bacteria)]